MSGYLTGWQQKLARWRSPRSHAFMLGLAVGVSGALLGLLPWWLATYVPPPVACAQWDAWTRMADPDPPGWREVVRPEPLVIDVPMTLEVLP